MSFLYRRVGAMGSLLDGRSFDGAIFMISARR